MKEKMPEKITYYKKGDDVLVTVAGDDYLAKPTEPDATLYMTWCDREAADILMGSWIKHIKVEPVEVTLDELDAKGGIFSEAARFVRFTHGVSDDDTQKTFKMYDYQVMPIARRDEDGQIELRLVTQEGSPFGNVTFADKNILLTGNEMAFKNYTENEGLLEKMIEAKMVSEPKRYIHTKYVDVPIVDVLVPIQENSEEEDEGVKM